MKQQSKDCCPVISWKTHLTQMSLACSISCCLPSKTYHLSGEKCSGGKNSKVRLTGMTAASATGERLEMFVIGKSKKPQCFENAN